MTSEIKRPRRLPKQFSVEAGFGTMIQIWHENMIVYQGDLFEIDRWIRYGCPLDCNEYDRLRIAAGMFGMF